METLGHAELDYVDVSVKLSAIAELMRAAWHMHVD